MALTFKHDAELCLCVQIIFAQTIFGEFQVTFCEKLTFPLTSQTFKASPHLSLNHDDKVKSETSCIVWADYCLCSSKSLLEKVTKKLLSGPQQHSKSWQSRCQRCNSCQESAVCLMLMEIDIVLHFKSKSPNVQRFLLTSPTAKMGGSCWNAVAVVWIVRRNTCSQCMCARIVVLAANTDLRHPYVQRGGDSHRASKPHMQSGYWPPNTAGRKLIILDQTSSGKRAQIQT